MSERDQMKALVVEAICQLEATPHATLPGLRQRYYYRGLFTRLEYLTPKAIAWNVARLHRIGQHEHAAALTDWAAADGGEGLLRRKMRRR